jgi:putative DNA primase/helicase
MFGNGKPRITDTSGGMWRRPRLINFGQPIPLNERDPQLSEKLRMELPGILNWALDGLRRVYERGLIVPEAVKAATDDYKEEEDRLAGFLKDCCVTGPNYTSTARDLWAAWSGWCSQNGEREGSQRAFGTELKSHNFTPSKSGSTRGWKGIGLLVQPTEAAENGTQGTD